LKAHEKKRVIEANLLWLNYMAVCESVVSKGGGYFWERPGDPGSAPFLSIWSCEEMCELEKRTGAVRGLTHQCPYGGLTPKFTCLSGTLADLADLDQVWCPGVTETHVRAKSEGVNAAGMFNTRRLQTYPPCFAKRLPSVL
jgi:hypothetical protein